MKAFKLLGLCLAMTVLLCQCQCRSDWPKYRCNQQNSGNNVCENSENKLSPANVASLFQAWAATTGGGVSSSPAVVNGTAYVGSADSNLYAFNIFNGLPQPGWPIAIGSGIFSPAVADGVVYVSQYGGSLFAFDAVTGALKPGGWPVTTNCDIGAEAVFGQGLVPGKNGVLRNEDVRKPITGYVDETQVGIFDIEVRQGLEAREALPLPVGGALVKTCTGTSELGESQFAFPGEIEQLLPALGQGARDGLDKTLWMEPKVPLPRLGL